MKWTRVALWAVLVTASPLEAADAFRENVLPFVNTYCVQCHGRQHVRGELDLSRYSEARQIIADFRRWSHVIEFVRQGDMPPEGEPQPTLDERRRVTETLEAILLEEAKKHAGDPGVVLPRRLSRTEYDLSIRDLTGIDIRPTRDFPPDPAAGEGFDNTGEALRMSPSLLKKYLSAAQLVADHLVLLPDRVQFAPFPVNSSNERKKLAEQAIIDFYHRHSVRIDDYLESAWRYRFRGEADRGLDIAAWAERANLSPKYLTLVWDTLRGASTGTGYLQQLGRLWEALPPQASADARPAELLKLSRFIDFCRRAIGQREEPLIRSHAGNWPIAHLDFRARTAARRDRVDAGKFSPRRTVRFEPLRAPKDPAKSSGGITLLLRIERAFDDGEGGWVLLRRPVFSLADTLPRNEDEARKHEVISLREVLERQAPDLAAKLAFGTHPAGSGLDRDSLAVQAPTVVEIPLDAEMLRQLAGKRLLIDCELEAGQRERSVHIQPASGRLPDDLFAAPCELLVHADSAVARQLAESGERFCHTFPDRFFYVDEERGLAAGFHLVEGFFRDDQPLMTKVLDERQQRQLDQLWAELEFVTQSTETLLRGFVWFERSERHVLHDARFDFLRAEDPRLVEDELLTRFERVYLEKLGVKLVDGTLQPEKPGSQYELVHGFFERVRTGLKRYREQLQMAEPRALRDLDLLAERAYGRPLRPDEVDSLRKLYASLRQRGQGVEAALRGVLTAVLMSPNFLYHYHEEPREPGIHRLSDHSLASRLSYFLWSSLPDDELLSVARAGKLQDEAVLRTQTRRLLADPRIEAFAREFFGQWLGYRDYLSTDPIHAAAFPGYDSALREAMFEEPVRLAAFLVREDKPVTELLRSDVTFVNGTLARHYGGDMLAQYRSRSANELDWQRVDGLRNLGRGGWLGMAVVLANNSAGERTSPVKRGFWTVHRLLGQHFPPPPADVPELPRNEKLATQTIRELLAAHTANPRCALCHTHFDGLGLTLEGFDPIGRARTKDLAGRPVDDLAVLPNGEMAKGIPGLIAYLEQHRRQDFVRTLCRKFLGYALGRSVLLSDQPLLHEMEAALEEQEFRFSVLFDKVILSRQFRERSF